MLQGPRGSHRQGPHSSHSLRHPTRRWLCIRRRRVRCRTCPLHRPVLRRLCTQFHQNCLRTRPCQHPHHVGVQDQGHSHPHHRCRHPAATRLHHSTPVPRCPYGWTLCQSLQRDLTQSQTGWARAWAPWGRRGGCSAAQGPRHAAARCCGSAAHPGMQTQGWRGPERCNMLHTPGYGRPPKAPPGGIPEGSWPASPTSPTTCRALAARTPVCWPNCYRVDTACGRCHPQCTSRSGDAWMPSAR
mmetsp:Transcript_20979/g.37516  ORF Transcript_20979/g.37516 Transcript_20979/m.37516 type:complete len:243 (+) Transcript_20979:3000-3728(+)